MGKKTMHARSLLLNNAIKEKNSDLAKLKQGLSMQTTWMKFKLVCFSIN